MKLYRTLFSILAFATVLITAHPALAESGGTSIKDVKQESKELLDVIGDYSVEQKDEAIQKSKMAMDDLDKRIDVLENKIDKSWDQMDGAARKKARAQMRALREKRNELAEWYGALKNSTADAWDHMKTGFTSAYKSVNSAWARSKKEYGEE